MLYFAKKKYLTPHWVETYKIRMVIVDESLVKKGFIPNTRMHVSKEVNQLLAYFRLWHKEKFKYPQATDKLWYIHQSDLRSLLNDKGVEHLFDEIIDNMPTNQEQVPFEDTEGEI